MGMVNQRSLIESRGSLRVLSHALVSLTILHFYIEGKFVFLLCIYIELLGMLESRGFNAGKIPTMNFKSQETDREGEVICKILYG